MQRGNDVRIPTDAANVEYPPISKRLTQSEEDAVWAHYEAMPPSTDDMKKASNVGDSKRWIIPAIVGAAFAIGIGYAALSERPAAVDEPALAASEAPSTDTSAAALMGGAPAASDPTVTTQSTFNSAQPNTVSAPPSTTAPSVSPVEPAARAAPAPSAARVAPMAPVAEPATPAPTYSRSEAPAATAPIPSPAPVPVPQVTDPTLNPTPLPSAPAQEPALNLDLAPSSETVPAPGSVPENAQSPQ